jgi:hypothetical protein
MGKHTINISKKNLGLAIIVALFMQFILTRISLIKFVPWNEFALLIYVVVAIYLLFF